MKFVVKASCVLALSDNMRSLDSMLNFLYRSKLSAPSPENFFFKSFHMIAPSLFRKPLRSADLPKSSTDEKWTGLSRYTTHDEKSDHSTSHEYAKLSTILETPVLDLTYYADVAGKLTSLAEDKASSLTYVS